MRSMLARIIAIAALIPLISTLWRFIDQARQTYRWDGLAVPQMTFEILGEGLLAPVTLFALAALIEMLHRISVAIPRVGVSAAAEPAPRFRLRPWRSTIANVLLLVAAATYAVSAWTAFQYFNSGQAEALGVPAEQSLSLTVSMVVYWLTAPVEIIALAAGVEYLSRIASAFQSNETVA